MLTNYVNAFGIVVLQLVCCQNLLTVHLNIAYIKLKSVCSNQIVLEIGTEK